MQEDKRTHRRILLNVCVFFLAFHTAQIQAADNLLLKNGEDHKLRNQGEKQGNHRIVHGVVG